MSLPRQVLPGTTYLLTRRCTQRQFLLRPDRRVNEIFRFCLAYAAQRFEVEIHAYCMLSNHYHLVATDRRGNLPAFMHWLNEYVAKCVNAKLGRWESFWSPGSYSAVKLVDRDDVLAKMRYVYLNPVAAGLVRRAREWPGAMSLPSEIGSTVEVERPPGFFRESGPVPRRLELRLTVPGKFDERDLAWLQDRLTAGEQAQGQRMLAGGKKVLGRRGVLRQSPFSRPRVRGKRRGLSPRIAARDKWRRIDMLQRLSVFVEAYYDARRRFIQGEREVVFPAGTYWFRSFFGVRCASP